MKPASNPSLRVDPELRQAAEAALREGGRLSDLQSMCDQAFRRQLQHKFILRGLDFREEARRTGEYFQAESVRAELRNLLTTASVDKGKR